MRRPSTTPGGLTLTGPIAIVTAGELFGGVERHVLGLGSFLARRGLRPQIVLFHDRELARRCRELELPVTVLAARGSYDREGPRELERILAGLAAELVHVHGYRAAVNAALTTTRRPLVITMHGQGEPSWRQPIVFAKDRAYRWAEAWACRRRRAVVCFVTTDLRRRHEGHFRGLDVRTIPNGIDPIDRAGLPAPSPPLVAGRFHALAVGRLTPIKGLDIALQALTHLEETSRWHLDLVGEGESKAELAALAASLGVADRVTFHGFRDDTEAVMAAADALIMPSLHEGLPYTLLEAMSVGLPVVASDVGGLAEVLRHEATGLLFPVGDAKALARGLSTLATAPERRAAVGLAAARLQRERYTLTAMGEAYLAAYERALLD